MRSRQKKSWRTGRRPGRRRGRRARPRSPPATSPPLPGRRRGAGVWLELPRVDDTPSLRIPALNRRGPRAQTTRSRRMRQRQPGRRSAQLVGRKRAHDFRFRPRGSPRRAPRVLRASRSSPIASGGSSRSTLPQLPHVSTMSPACWACGGHRLSSAAGSGSDGVRAERQRLDGQHNEPAADIADPRVVGLERPEARQHRLTDGGGLALDEAVGPDRRQRGQGGGAGDRVAAECAAAARSLACGASISSARPVTAASGMPPAMPFAVAMMSGTTPLCSQANRCPVRAKPGRCSSWPTTAPRAPTRRPASELDRKSGHVVVWAAWSADDSGHGCCASTTTPRPGSVVSRPPRHARRSCNACKTEDEQVLGDFLGKEGDIVSGARLQHSNATRG